MRPIRRKGTQGWWIHYKRPETGKYTWKKLGEHYVDAKTAMLQHLNAPLTSPGGEFEVFCEQVYLPYKCSILSPKSFEREQGCVKLLTEYFKTLQEVDKPHAICYISMRSGKVSSETVRKEIQVLIRICKHAVMAGKLSFNSLNGLPLPKVNPARTRYLQPAEFQKLLATMPENYRAPILLAVSTGMRRSEILTLTWTQVDLVNGFLRLERTKNGYGRTVPLNATALGVLEQLPRPSDKLFPSIDPDYMSQLIRNKSRSLGICDLRLHDLRHTFASWLALNNVPIRAIAELLGHRDLRQTMRYSQLSGEHLKRAVGTIEESLNVRIADPSNS